MKKAYWVTGIVLAILIVAAMGSYRFYYFKISQGDVPDPLVQNGSTQNGYYVYDGIPVSFEYTSHGDEIPDELIANVSDYFVRISGETRELGEAFGLDVGKYVCSNGESIVEVKYFYDLCEGTEGCGYERRALVCGDIYFVEQYADWTGPVLYGPFSTLSDSIK